METKSKIERHGAFGEVDDVALWGVDEDFVGEEIEPKFLEVDLFAVAKFGGGVLEFCNPEEVGGEVLDFALFVIFRELLFVIIETGGKSTFGIFVHFSSANLELDDFLGRGDDSGVEGLITVLFGDGDVVLDASVHGSIEGMKKTHGEIARGDVGNDNAESGEVVDFSHVLVVFGELLVERINGFDAAGDFEIDFFAF